jgi:hypothetical protein
MLAPTKQVCMRIILKEPGYYQIKKINLEQNNNTSK